MARVLILGGTKEALRIAAERVAQGDDVTTSLAGRTREPHPPEGDVRVGGFGGDEGLATYLLESGIIELVDATHPFATRISANARAATESAGVPLTVVNRPPWEAQPGDDWIEVETIPEAVGAIPSGARVLLALGSQHIAPFAARDDVHFTIRRIDPPEEPLDFAKHDIIIGRPGSSVEEETPLLADRKITHIVCRNSGGDGAYSKIASARLLGLPVIMVARPT
jgi:precorrin-6A/cobalt-precorrin-6A reductase